MTDNHEALARGRSEAKASSLRPWLFFALQQALIFASGVAVLQAVRRLTGATLHGAASAVGLFEAAAILAMYALHLALTVGIFRYAQGPTASLGLALSPRRTRHFAAGLFLAFVLHGWPWLAAWAVGDVRVTDTVAAHPDQASVAQVGFWLGALVVNSVVEEAMSRAFPMRLWSDRPLWFRVLVPSLVFAAIHLADEGFRASSFASRTLAGVTFGLAYAATGNIWLCAGLHTGVNYAILWRSGSWHTGSLVRMEGQPLLSDQLTTGACALLAVVAYRGWQKTRSQDAAPGG